ASSDKSGCGGVDDRTRKDVSMTTTNVTIKVKPLPEGVFLATSDDVPGLTVECETRDEIIATAPEIALELLEIEAGHPLTPRPVVTSQKVVQTIASRTKSVMLEYDLSRSNIDQLAKGLVRK